MFVAARRRRAWVWRNLRLWRRLPRRGHRAQKELPQDLFDVFRIRRIARRMPRRRPLSGRRRGPPRAEVRASSGRERRGLGRAALARRLSFPFRTCRNRSLRGRRGARAHRTLARADSTGRTRAHAAVSLELAADALGTVDVCRELPSRYFEYVLALWERLAEPENPPWSFEDPGPCESRRSLERARAGR